MPKLLLCSEFGGREGDIRLEVVRKLKNDLYQNFFRRMTMKLIRIYLRGSCIQPAILPADVGLYIDLKTLKIRCSETGTLIDPFRIKWFVPKEDSAAFYTFRAPVVSTEIQ